MLITRKGSNRIKRTKRRTREKTRRKSRRRKKEIKEREIISRIKIQKYKGRIDGKERERRSRRVERGSSQVEGVISQEQKYS